MVPTLLLYTVYIYKKMVLYSCVIKYVFATAAASSLSAPFLKKK